ncbi:hypothetical protein RHGRI_037542 [Rhododendron griersonianum]|uniref:Uncharacterized protein n=1 Tax=Rhododendron griersonianum TaxID=479676 RepID=A0AAV6HSJ6_9ERIC|nr:hypothetical protein RHGRI_037542 [Rhododendron griersonianum]
METSIASSPSIGKEEVFYPTYESNVHFDWGLEGCAMEMEVDKEEGAMDIVVSEPRSQQERHSSDFSPQTSVLTSHSRVCFHSSVLTSHFSLSVRERRFSRSPKKSFEAAI